MLLTDSTIVLVACIRSILRTYLWNLLRHANNWAQVLIKLKCLQLERAVHCAVLIRLCVCYGAIQRWWNISFENKGEWNECPSVRIYSIWLGPLTQNTLNLLSCYFTFVLSPINFAYKHESVKQQRNARALCVSEIRRANEGNMTRFLCPSLI